MLADFCFADLLLYVPTKDDRWLIVGQVRPATAQTVYHTDWVGDYANASEQSVLSSAFRSGEITEGDVEVEALPDAARMLAIPVRHDGKAIAVLTREWVQRAGRPPGELERTYVSIFDRFAEMIAEGSFPYPSRGADSTAAPRVGDGVMSLDADGRVTYLSPNANSALHRVGIHANAVGMTPRRDRLPRRHGAQGVRAAGAGRRGVRADVRHRPPVPLPADPRRRQDRRRGPARARRHRRAQAGSAADQQGRHDPRDPPPGEEQPADDLVAAAPAGPPAGEPGGQGGRVRVGPADPHDRPRPRVAVAGAGRRRDVHRDRAAAAAARRGEPAVAGPPGPLQPARRRRAHPGPGRHAAVGRAHRADAERRRPRLPRGQRRRQGRRQPRQRPGAAAHRGHRRRPRPRVGVRSRLGHRSRAVDRAHARDDRAQRADLDAPGGGQGPRRGRPRGARRRRPRHRDRADRAPC